jgi:hypothetical protein
MIVDHKFGYELTVLKKQIDSKMVCIGKTRPILQWQNSWFTGCDGNPAYLERENYHAWRATPIRKEVYQPILKN